MVMPITVQQESSLTGRYRVRRGWFGRLILQVECNVDSICGLNRERNVKTIWRDAKEEDVGLKYGVVQFEGNSK